MSRSNKYDNIFDEHDDGADLAVTAEDEAASDDQGREEAAEYIAAAAKVGGNKKVHSDHRRMWVRMAKKALAEGRERRTKADAAEKAQLASDRKAERERVAKEEQIRRNRALLAKSGAESDAMWARIHEETRVANAAWAAGKEEREAAERAEKAEVRPTPIQTAAGRPGEARPQQRPASPATANPIQQALPSMPPTTIPAAAAPGNRMSESRPVRTTPTGETTTRLPEPAPPRRATRTSPPPGLVRRPAQPLTPEPQRRVAPPSTQPAWAPPSVAWPPRSAAATTQAPPSPGRPAAAPSTVVVPEAPRSALPAAGRVLTGADLAAWRGARGLTQRPAADLLGVAPSTVAKAELLPAKVLGDQLQVALAGALGA